VNWSEIKHMKLLRGDDGPVAGHDGTGASGAPLYDGEGSTVASN
jgi:hypothetical protein